MSSINKVTLIGRCGNDPEIRPTKDGKRVATFSIATNDRWKDKQTGRIQERTEWHRIVVFNEHLLPVVEQYVTKGKQVYLEGQLQTRKWMDKNQVERYTTEVVIASYTGALILLGSGGQGFSVEEGLKEEVNVPSAPMREGPRLLEDEIPF